MEDSYFGVCDSCNCHVKKLIKYRRPGEWDDCKETFTNVPLYLCRLCAYTSVGQIKKDEVKKLFGSSEIKVLIINDIGQSICYIGNEILKAINDLKEDI